MGRPPGEVVGGAYSLEWVGGRLELCRDGVSGGVCLELREIRQRVRQGAKLDVARACGCRPGLTVLDAMAGFGVDGLALATLGCRVHLVERSLVMFRLLEDGIARWAAQGELRDRVELTFAEAADVLDHRRYQVVYLDPMFAPRSKSALPNKRAQFLADLLQHTAIDIDRDMLERARRAALERVVLKRRRNGPELIPPDWQIVGRSVRFDVYRGSAGS